MAVRHMLVCVVKEWVCEQLCRCSCICWVACQHAAQEHAELMRHMRWQWCTWAVKVCNDLLPACVQAQEHHTGSKCVSCMWGIRQRCQHCLGIRI